MKKTLAALLLCLSACKTAPEVVPVAAPTLPQQEFTVVTQSLTSVEVKYTGTVQAEAAFTLDRAAWEFVVDGEVKKSGETKLGGTTFELSESLEYVKDEEELKAMDTRGGSMLLALRGTLFVTVSGQSFEVPFAKSREVRTPRLPHLKLNEVDAGRFSEVEVQATLRLGVVNPNPFEISISGVEFAVTMAGKEVNKGVVGKGDRVSPSSTGVFEVTATLNEETHGKEASKIVKSKLVPWSLTSKLSAALYNETLESKGEIKLTR